MLGRGLAVTHMTALYVLAPAPPAVPGENPCGSGIVLAGIGQDSAAAQAQTCKTADSEGTAPDGDAQQVATKPDPIEYRIVLACDAVRISDTPGGDQTNCSYSLTACQYRVPPSNELLYRLESRPRGTAGAWTTVNEMCGLDNAPSGAAPPPAVPTMGQIQTAFRALPFSKPTVRVEPKGNVTLVNLPTYYEAVWPDDSGLEPGEVSKPMQLLSWSVEFKISSRSYNFHYGDGTSSGPVEDAGGGHPEGTIRHTFTQPDEAAKVSVDAQLTGQFRVNGGEWNDIATVADLQDEPVTTLHVKEARARLYDS